MNRIVEMLDESTLDKIIILNVLSIGMLLGGAIVLGTFIALSF